MSSDEGPPAPLSEVGAEETQNAAEQTELTTAEKLLGNMEALLSRVLAVQQTPPVAANQQIPLLKFDPDEPDADIDGWCKVTEIIIQNKQLEGVNLLVALTGALKGRAAACLTKLNLDQITWSSVKEILIARFCKPKLPQDYFDEILRFQVGTKMSATEFGLRLWTLIERIPKCTMVEEVITGFVVSLLCQKNSFIRRELHSQTVTNRAQLFRILGGIPHKRRLDAELQEPETKRARTMEKNTGRCHYCGLFGHRIAECRKRRDELGTKSEDASNSSLTTGKTTNVICSICGRPRRPAPARPANKGGCTASVKEVHQCEHRPSRGTLQTSSGESSLV